MPTSDARALCKVIVITYSMASLEKLEKLALNFQIVSKKSGNFEKYWTVILLSRVGRSQNFVR